MAQVAANVLVGRSGALYVAPSGTPLPTTASMPLNAAFVELGYVSEDGVTETPEEDTSEIRAWQGSTIVRRVTSSYEHRFSFKLIETKKPVLELYFKGSTVQSDGGTGFKLDVKSPTTDRRAFVLDVVDGDKVVRNVVEDGEVVERGEITYGAEDAVGYEVTLTAYPNTAQTVVTKLSDDPAWDES